MNKVYMDSAPDYVDVTKIPLRKSEMDINDSYIVKNKKKGITEVGKLTGFDTTGNPKFDIKPEKRGRFYIKNTTTMVKEPENFNYYILDDSKGRGYKKIKSRKIKNRKSKNRKIKNRKTKRIRKQ